MCSRWMGASLSLSALGLGAAVLAFSVQAAAQAQSLAAGPPERPVMERVELAQNGGVRHSRCRPVTAFGSAPTERLARLQAWERIAQATGNWPVPADTLRKERYDCRKAGAIWQCRSAIEVCRST